MTRKNGSRSRNLVVLDLDLSRRGAGAMCSICTLAFLKKYHGVDNSDGRDESWEVATAVWGYITSDEWI